MSKLMSGALGQRNEFTHHIGHVGQAEPQGELLPTAKGSTLERVLPCS
jgi:hypothetical protein